MSLDLVAPRGASTTFVPPIAHTIDVVARSEGVSIATIRRWVREKRYPRPVKTAGERGRCVWYDEILRAHRAAQIAKTAPGLLAIGK